MMPVCAVIVPVHRRPHQAERFMKSLADSEADAFVYAVADNETDAQAWVEAGADVFMSNDESFAKKVNLAYTYVIEPWMILVGDDVHFHPGWLDIAVAAAGDEFHVVCINDWTNGKCKAGEHATHPMIRTAYVNDVGASWDGPGVVCHEGYRHCYVDDEITLAAKQRGVFVNAPGAVIEHLHPIVGKAPQDATYTKGWSQINHDWKIFERRRAQNAH